MHSGIVRLTKALAIVIWILGGIIGIALGSLGSIYSYTYSYGGSGSFNMWTMLLTWLIFFITGVLYFSFGILVGHVTDHREGTRIQLEQISAAFSRVLAAADGAKALSPEERAFDRAIYHDPLSESIRANTAQTVTPEPVRRAPEGTVYSKREMRHASSTTLICPYCGREQFNNRGSCLWCGATFID